MPEDSWDPIDSIGPTGTTVAANIKRLRKQRGLAFTELSARLGAIDRPIPPLGLRKIESGGRRLDTDDLTALAVALGVSPITLLMPADTDTSTAVTATGVGNDIPAERLWAWLGAAYPLRGAVLPFFAEALPPWASDRMAAQLGPMAGLMETREPETVNGDD